MIFDRVDIQLELSKEQKNHPDLLGEINALLDLAAKQDSDIEERLKCGDFASFPIIDLQKLDPQKIVSLEAINQICVKYRLRFLDSKFFKSQFPYEAIFQINAFEKEHQIKIQKFKIIAPYGLFHLKDANEDPLLFVQLSENRFYLLHKWGTDLKWHRGILNYPVRSIYTFFFSTILLAALVAWSFPFDWLNINQDSELQFRFWLNTHFTIAFFFFFLFLGSLSNASFSDSAWDSEFYNH